jgi:hypothetical protein
LKWCAAAPARLTAEEYRNGEINVNESVDKRPIGKTIEFRGEKGAQTHPSAHNAAPRPKCQLAHQCHRGKWKRFFQLFSKIVSSLNQPSQFESGSGAFLFSRPARIETDRRPQELSFSVSASLQHRQIDSAWKPTRRNRTVPEQTSRIDVLTHTILPDDY